MKKLINRPEDVVEQIVEGLAAIHGGLRRLPGHTVLVRAELPQLRRVAVISGGGSGHEPAHAGYVGAGMLSAAVAGDVFTSPSPDAVLAAIRATAGPAGALLIVKNYTGDRLNFGLAAEMARAEGIAVEVVLVADDVALGHGDHAGARGLAGTVLVHKIAGATAEVGRPLAEVAVAARRAAAEVRTMGVALTPCTVPAAGRPGFSLGENEIELGLGIHGEAGVRRGPLAPADVLVDGMLEVILEGHGRDWKRVVLMVNNLGGTPPMELAIVARRAVANVEGRGKEVVRVYCGTFLSALEMAGVSISVMSVDDEERLALLDAPTGAPAWPNVAATPRRRGPSEAPPAVAASSQGGGATTAFGTALRGAIATACAALVADADRLTRLDQVVGDGDLGASVERGAKAVTAALDGYPLDDPAATLQAVGLTIQRAVGGTTGPLYATFLLRVGAKLRGVRPEDAAAWAEAFRAGCEAIMELGGAARGDRTMLDALIPAAEAFRIVIGRGEAVKEALRAAAEAAREGVVATAQMRPRRGRSSYLGERVLGHTDPGAEAVATWLTALATG